jgi:hypothetical protein
MARKKKTRKRNKRTHDFLNRLLLLIVSAALALCVASFTYGFYIRHDGRGGRGSFRVEVLNGTGRAGLARAAAKSLRKMGIDVYSYGNAEDFDYEESILIARRRGDIEVLAKLINCRNVMEQLQKNPIVDATLILGADYDRLYLGLKDDSSLP